MSQNEVEESAHRKKKSKLWVDIDSCIQSATSAPNGMYRSQTDFPNKMHYTNKNIQQIQRHLTVLVVLSPSINPINM